MRCCAYLRLSKDQTGEELGVTRQREDCRDLAHRLGWEMVTEFVDNDVSAYTGKRRDGFEQMLAAMETHQVEAVVAYHADRLYRNLADLERLIVVAEANHVQLRTVSSGDLDLSNATGKMVARILGSVARQESERKAERQRRANIQRAEAGQWLSTTRVFGYTASGEPREPEATMVRTAIADVLGGKSIQQVVREWNQSGVTGTRGRPFTGPNMKQILVNPRYAGQRLHRGKLVAAGKWTPLIDLDTHLGIVAMLSDPTRKTTVSFERKHLGSGIYVCGVCGDTLRHTVSGGKNAGQRKYACSTSTRHVVVAGPPLDKLVEDFLLDLLAATGPQRFGIGVDGPDMGELHTKRAAIQARLDQLAAMFGDGSIDASQLRSGSARLRSEAAGMDAVIAAAVRTSPAARLFAAGAELVETWDKCSPDLKGKILNEVLTVTVNKSTGPTGNRFDAARIGIEPRV